MQQVQDFTRGSIAKQLLIFYIPMFLTNMLQQVYSFVDTAIVGNGLGDHALAAVGNMGSLTFLIIGFSTGLANGFAILVAQAFGEKDYEKLRRVIASSIELVTIISVVLTIGSLFCLEEVLRLLQTDSSIMGESLRYGSIIFGGLITAIFYNMSAFILRALGDSRTPLTAIIISSVLNVVLDCLFIFGFKTGVEGAAIATVIAQMVSASICIRKIWKIEFIRLHKTDFRNGMEIYKALLRNGVPVAFMNSITAIGCMVVQYFVNGYGVNYTSAYSVCGRYLNLVMTPAATAGQAVSTFIGQNDGAGRYDRIQKGLRVCLGIAACSYVILGGMMLFLSRPLAQIMLTGEEPIRLVCEYLSVCGIMLVFVDFLFVYRSAVQGMGEPFMPMVSGIIEMVFRIVVIVLFMKKIGFEATAYAEAVAWIGALAINMHAYRKVMKKRLQVEQYVELSTGTEQ